MNTQYLRKIIAQPTKLKPVLPLYSSDDIRLMRIYTQLGDLDFDTFVTISHTSQKSTPWHEEEKATPKDITGKIIDRNQPANTITIKQFLPEPAIYIIPIESITEISTANPPKFDFFKTTFRSSPRTSSIVQLQKGQLRRAYLNIGQHPLPSNQTHKKPQTISPSSLALENDALRPLNISATALHMIEEGWNFFLKESSAYEDQVYKDGTKIHISEKEGNLVLFKLRNGKFHIGTFNSAFCKELKHSKNKKGTPLTFCTHVKIPDGLEISKEERPEVLGKVSFQTKAGQCTTFVNLNQIFDLTPIKTLGRNCLNLKYEDKAVITKFKHGHKPLRIFSDPCHFVNEFIGKFTHIIPGDDEKPVTLSKNNAYDSYLLAVSETARFSSRGKRSFSQRNGKKGLTEARINYNRDNSMTVYLPSAKSFKVNKVTEASYTMATNRIVTEKHKWYETRIDQLKKEKAAKIAELKRKQAEAERLKIERAEFKQLWGEASRPTADVSDSDSDNDQEPVFRTYNFRRRRPQNYREDTADAAHGSDSDYADDE